MQREGAVLTFIALILFLIGIGIPFFWEVTVLTVRQSSGLIAGPIFIAIADDEITKFARDARESLQPYGFVTCQDPDEANNQDPLLAGDLGGECNLFYATLALGAFGILCSLISLGIGCSNQHGATIPSFFCAGGYAAVIILYSQNTVFASLETRIEICDAINNNGCDIQEFGAGAILVMASAVLQGVATLFFGMAQMCGKKGYLP